MVPAHVGYTYERLWNKRWGWEEGSCCLDRDIISTEKKWLFIHRLLASGTSNHILPELKDAAFYMQMLDQVMTYFFKYNFIILAKLREYRKLYHALFTT